MRRTSPLSLLLASRAGISILLLCSLCIAIDPSSLQKGTYANLSYTFSGGQTINYDLYVPASYTPSSHLPVIVYMHGGGPRTYACVNAIGENACVLPYLRENPNWNESQNPCAILEPRCSPSWCGTSGRNCWDGLCAPAGSHVHDLSSPPVALKIVRNLLSIVIKDLGFDSTRCYVIGWSNGGSAVWDFIEYWPDFFAAGIAIAGAGDTLHAARALNIPVWATASRDDNTVPFAATEQMVNKLIALGGSPKYTYFNGWSHASNYPTYIIPEIVPWLLSQKKSNLTVHRLNDYTDSRKGKLVSSVIPVISLSSNGLQIIQYSSINKVGKAAYNLHGKMICRRPAAAVQR